MSHEGEKMTGKAKQVGGKLTDNKQMETEGKIQIVKANTKQTADNMKAKISDN